MLYTDLTRPLTQKPFRLEVWMQDKTAPIDNAKCSTLNEGWLRFESVTIFIPCQRTSSIKNSS